MPDDLWMLESPELKDPPEAAVKDSKTLERGEKTRGSSEAL